MTVIMTAIMTAIPVMTGAAGICFAAGNETACYSVDEAGEALRAAMKERAASADILLITDTAASDSEDIINEIFDKAIEHTGDPREGDYLKFQYYNCKASAETAWENGAQAIHFKYSVSYYDTAEQEAELDEAVKGILEDLDLDEKSDYEKTECIYDYICENVEYDQDHLDDEEYVLKYTAYAALVKGKAVCQGYAEALYRLLLEAGVDNRIINGTATGSLGEQEKHAWNIVRMEDLYYNTDVTNDAGLLKKETFLKGTGSFTEDHIRAEEYESEAFSEAYPMGEKDYTDPDAGFFSRLEAFADSIRKLFSLLTAA